MKQLIISLLFLSSTAVAQTYNQQLQAWQQHYKQDFITETRSPLKGNDTGYIRFYSIDNDWCTSATLKLTPDAKPFQIATHSGKTKPFRQYGLLTIVVPQPKGPKTITLSVYESLNPGTNAAAGDDLFLPFNDLTNYETTYAGGRYIDLRKQDVHDGKLTVDFNKAYNPYCAFAEGYSCPIPPDENKLKVRIEAGEKLFAKPSKD